MLSHLSPESLERVADMSRLRREREAIAQEAWKQSYRLTAQQESFLLDARMALEEEEETGRAILAKAEAVAFERIIAQKTVPLPGRPSNASTDPDLARRRRQLERQVRATEFRLFCKSNTVTDRLEPTNSDVTLRRAAVTVLRKAYEYSAPAFASDLEDLWKRGIAIAPDLQRQGRTNEFTSELELPPYHDFAIEMRNRYSAYKANQVPKDRRDAASSPLGSASRAAGALYE
jgi:hypothetical protein